MYVPPAFKTDDTAAWAFAAVRGFGTVIAVVDGLPVAVHVPFLTTEDANNRRLEFHVARANPIGTRLAKATKALVVVAGPDSYVSPDWYLTPNQVPTWNYVSVHISGTAKALPRDRVREHIDSLSARFENRLAPKRPWTTAKMPASQVEKMMTAIIPIELDVEHVEAQWKLNQNKSRSDRANVMRMLASSGHWSSLAIADMMQEGLNG
jgi:transcriptional regulator